MRKKKKMKEESHVDESWLLPYSDLLTLLLALFIVLFAMSEIDAKKYEQLSMVFKSEFTGGRGVLEHQSSPVEAPEPKTLPDSKKDANNKNEMTSLEEVHKEINQYIKANNLSDELQTKLTGEGLLVSIYNDLYFDIGSARVNGEGEKIAREISEFLNTDPPHQIVVSGHTDDLPIVNSSKFESNWELSATRALNFMSLLLDNNKLNPKRFSAKGYGEHNPLVPNNSKENRAKNRRVEVLILPNKKDE
ncbi:chemotaxis protein MotB [Salinibacillus kushneri]|uniref:Chemotaxis protein MotB n=1 Tax=Salinibacillus kushneri TaxID=237682 RepID=A0A1I0EPY7_9BACI|nr:flagellar motor protein MotB [Salinibacillus kushneri]SET47583.1 chemotaxis protein MotB [Salinibacillus kushneri]